MTVFVDTSAYYSLLDVDEENNENSRHIWRNLFVKGTVLITSNYVVVESVALVQRRLGMAAVADFQETLLALTQVIWVDHAIHNAAFAALLTANRRQLSLVDCTSFELCRGLGVHSVFAFDKHFSEQGFQLLDQ